MQTPTLVIITDRNDLDEQLFGTFAGSKELLRQMPVHSHGHEGPKGELAVDENPGVRRIAGICPGKYALGFILGTNRKFVYAHAAISFN